MMNGKVFLFALFWLGVLLDATSTHAQPLDTLWTFLNRHPSINSLFKSVIPTPDGGCLIGGEGNLHPDSTTPRGLLFKLDAQGQPQWSRAYARMHYIYRVEPTRDGGYIVGGGWGTGMALYKTDSLGEPRWYSTAADIRDGRCVGISERPDGDIWALAAGDYGHSDQGAMLVRLRPDGEYVWHGYVTPPGAWANKWLPRTDGSGYVVATAYNWELEGPDAYVARVDSHGSRVWEQRWGESQRWLWGADTTLDGGLIVCGNTDAGINAPQYPYLMRLSASGDTVWSQIYGETEGYLIVVRSLPAGGYLCLGADYEGHPDRQLRLRQVAEGGAVVWEQTFGTPTADWAMDMGTLTNGTHILAGYQIDPWMNGLAIAVGEPDAAAPGPVAPPAAMTLISCSPNPFNAMTTFSFQTEHPSWIQLRIFDLLGRRVATVFEGHVPAGDQTFQWNAAGFGSGTYFCTINTPSGMLAFSRVTLLR